MKSAWKKLAESLSLKEDFRSQVEDNYPESIPWKVVAKILAQHGISRDEYEGEGLQMGVPPWMSQAVPTDLLLDFMGY